MPPKALQNIKYGQIEYQWPKSSEETEEDIMRPPCCSSSTEEESPGDIEAVLFNRGCKKEEKNEYQDKAIEKTQMASFQSNNSYGGVNSYRLRKRLDSSSQINNTRDLKNYENAELPELPIESFANASHKRIPGRKTYRAVYGKMSHSSSQSTAYSQPNSSQASRSSINKKSTCIKLPSSDSDELEDQISVAFKPPSDEFQLQSSDSDEYEDDNFIAFKPPSEEFKLPNNDPNESEEDSSVAFKPPCDEFLNSTCFRDLESKSLTKAIKKPAYKNCDSSPDSKRIKINSPTNTILDYDFPLPNHNSPKKYHETSPPSFSDPCSSLRLNTQKSAKEQINDDANVLFKTYSDLDCDNRFSLSSDEIVLSQGKGDSDLQMDNYLSMSVMPRCPMCYEPVSPNNLRTCGQMNTRQQEQFCLEHRKKSAKNRWEINRYPHIDWDNLDARISKHHKFLERLISGKESYYRSLLQDKIDRGKDRNLRTATTNLIPGYYGPRGLRIISENLFRKFTPLLKKRIVQDRLIAARGYTPYVQSVLVPEVATLLIQEDMHITLSEAREIMAESVVVGELLHEEVREDFISPAHHKKSSFEED
ncbi:hypothetical protein HI914_01545 [Erysiphe necator]|nr:hypothetical protein HI914_01545 [Erysiphe necator]